MVCDGAVKDQDQETAAASTASAASVVAASEASPAPVVVVVSARPSARSSPHDKRLGVRHPLKHRRFRAGGKMMVEPGGVPPAHAVPEGEEEEEEEEEGASEVEEEELVEAEAEQASSAGTAMRGTEVEVSSAPAAGVQEMEVEVEGGEMEVKYGEMEVSPEPAVAVGGTELEAHPDEEDEVSSISVARGEKKQEAASPPPAASAVLAVEAPREMGQYGERAEKERRDKERERQKERERDKKDYDSKHERYEDGGSRKSLSKTSRTEEEAYSYRRDTDANEISAKEKYNNPDMQADKHSRRKDDSEDTDKWPADNRDSDDRKTLSRYEHGKSRSSKEQRFDDDKYKEKYKDDYVRDKRQHDDKFSDERVARGHESDRADYKSAKDGHRSSESHYRKDAVQDVDHYEDYGNRYKESRGKKRPPEENDDQYDLKPPSTRDQRVHLEKSSGSGRLDSLIERARPDRSSSPSKIHSRSSPSPSSYHDKDQSRHGSKVIDHGKREMTYDERNSRPRTSSGRERTPGSRLRDRDAENWSSERLKQKDDHQPRDVALEISTSSHYDRTPRKDKHTSPKQLSEKSPSSGDQRFSGRLSGGRSLDNKGERNSLTKYRDRDGDLAQERSHHQDRTPAKVPFREPTPSNSSISRGGHFSGSSPNHPLPPSARNSDSSFLGLHDDDRRPHNGDRRFHGHQKRNDMNSVRGHGHAWNNPPNWPSPVSNGFVPIQHGGAPGFHPPVHQFPGPPMFNLRPQMKLNQPGVSYPMHDAVDRFSTHMRPFGWPNHLDEACPPHMQVWNGGSGVFPGEPYMYGRQEWDQNRPHAGSRGWEMTGDVSKGPNDVPDAELPVAKKEPDSAITAVSDSGGQHNLQPQAEQKEIRHLTTENLEAKDDDSKSLKSLEAPQGAQPVTSLLSKNGVVFSKNYLSRISVSHDLVESELYKRCISLLGDLGIRKASHLVRNELQDNGNIEKMSTKYGSCNPFTSRYLKGDSAIFQRALALHKNQTQKCLITASASVKMEENMDVPEDDHDEEMLELVVCNPALQCHTDVMAEGSLSNQEHGDGIGGTIPATIGSGGLDAPPESPLPQPEVVVATTGITQPNKDMEDVLPPAIEDGALQATLEHAVGILEVTPDDGLEDVAPSAVGESGDDMEIMPPAIAEPRVGKDPDPIASPPDSQEKPSIMQDTETGMEVEVDKVIDDSPGVGRVGSILGTKLDVAATDGDSEALLVESRVNLSRIPNSPESTH